MTDNISDKSLTSDDEDSSNKPQSPQETPVRGVQVGNAKPSRLPTRCASTCSPGISGIEELQLKQESKKVDLFVPESSRIVQYIMHIWLLTHTILAHEIPNYLSLRTYDSHKSSLPLNHETEIGLEKNTLFLWQAPHLCSSTSVLLHASNVYFYLIITYTHSNSTWPVLSFTFYWLVKHSNILLWNSKLQRDQA